MLGEPVGHPAQLVVEPLGVGDVAREGLLVRDRDPLGRDLELRAGRSRARGRAACARPCRRRAGRRRKARRARRSSRSRRRAGARRRAGRSPAARAGQRREERRLAPRPDDGQSAGLVPVGRDLRDDLRGRDAERAREPRPRAHDGLHGLGERAGVVEGGRDLAEIEVALVDPGLLDGRHDVAHDRPHLARVLAVERHPRPHEDRLRAAAQGLRAGHRRDDAEAPRDVVRRRDDAAPVRVAADDERHASELGALQLLDRREERVEVEMRDDRRHGTRVVGSAAGHVSFRSETNRKRRGDGEAHGVLSTHLRG